MSQQTKPHEDAMNKQIGFGRKTLRRQRLTAVALLSCVCLTTATSRPVGATEVGQDAAKAGQDAPKVGQDTPKAEQNTAKAGQETPKSGQETPAQKTFATPEQAADALAAAWHSGQMNDLLEIFGPEGEKLVSSGDPVADKGVRDKLAGRYDKKHRIENDGEAKATIVMGDEDWPYPFPLVKTDAGWRFDVKAGAQQIIDRRVGRNELNAIAVSRAYVEAQRDFAARNKAAKKPGEYAQRMPSSEGTHDGLYWPTAEGEEKSPLGPLVADAEASGYGVASGEGRAPFRGYYFRILTRQGDKADGGARNYIVDGHMTGGFAMIAFPAKFRSSGIMTFIVNQDGIVFQKNLGPDTASIAESITEYNPDDSWKIVDR